MLGSAVSSSTPKDFQPNSDMGVSGSCPAMNRHAAAGPAMGCPYVAVGMQRALDSAIGLPSNSTSALWMLGFLMPADVRRSLMLPPGVSTAGELLGLYGSVRGRDWRITENSSAPALPSSVPQGTFPDTGAGERFWCKAPANSSWPRAARTVARAALGPINAVS